MVRHSPSPWSERFAISLLVDFLASSLSRLSSPFPIGISVDGAAVMSYSHRSLHLYTEFSWARAVHHQLVLLHRPQRSGNDSTMTHHNVANILAQNNNGYGQVVVLGGVVDPALCPVVSSAVSAVSPSTFSSSTVSSSAHPHPRCPPPPIPLLPPHPVPPPLQCRLRSSAVCPPPVGPQPLPTLFRGLLAAARGHRWRGE